MKEGVMTKDTSREAADRGQRALAYKLPHMTDDNPMPDGTMLGGHSVDDWMRWFVIASERILGEHGVYLPDGDLIGLARYQQLLKVEAAARDVDDWWGGRVAPGTPWSKPRNALCAALATDGAET